jgi:glycosyltransferase involved in cell wall biosynthesis
LAEERRFEILMFSADYLPNVGGLAIHVHELSRALQSLGQSVRVVTVRRGYWKHPRTWRSRSFLLDGVQVVQLSLTTPPRGFSWESRLLHGMRRLRARLVDPARPVVVHCHDYVYGVPVAVDCGSAAIKVFTNHTSTFLQELNMPGTHPEWQRRLSAFDRIIGPSRELADGSAAIGYDSERISFIPNGVDAERFKPDPGLRREVRAELGVSGDDAVVLCARRIVPKNGIIDFAHSLRFLGEQAANAVVVLTADASSSDSYERETIDAARKSLADSRLRLIGTVPNAQIRRYYVAADLAILPSLKEATSITGLEAMACGLPLLGTNIGGIPDLIDDEGTGLLVDPGDPRALAAALCRLIADPGWCRRLGAQAREKVLRSFTWKNVAERTLSVYEQSLRAVHSGLKASNSKGSSAPLPPSQQRP